MGTFLSGLILGFREGLEAFLIVAIILQYLTKINKNELKKNIWLGVLGGISISLIIGFILSKIENAIQNTERFAKIWESSASLVALVLVTTFIVWMIKHGSNMVSHIKEQVDVNLSGMGIFLVAFIMVAREGTEIAIFTFAGKYDYLSIIVGIAISLVLTILIFYSLIKVNIKIIFNITLAYLILQAGFLLGYGIHEGLSALNDLGYISAESTLFTKLFNLSGTILDHKNGFVGIPAYVLLGWYSRPEWIQFIMQYSFTICMFMFWRSYKHKG